MPHGITSLAHTLETNNQAALGRCTYVTQTQTQNQTQTQTQTQNQNPAEHGGTHTDMIDGVLLVSSRGKLFRSNLAHQLLPLAGSSCGLYAIFLPAGET
jgi:hypothetical protein